MKLSLAALAVCTLALTAQDNPAGQLKHLSVPTATSLRPVSVAAMEIEIGLPYPSVIHLKGSVEIRTPVCVVTGPGNAWTCNGSVVLRADEADLHEDTGQIEASGNVKVTRERTADAHNGR
ncbi:MAG: hypothetical protein ACLQU1_11930 [Bryobacteraceae bacterium]